MSALFPAKFLYASLVLLAHLLWPLLLGRQGSYPSGRTRRRWDGWWAQDPKVKLWLMHLRAETGKADLPLPGVVRTYLGWSEASEDPKNLPLALTFRPEILWA